MRAADPTASERLPKPSPQVLVVDPDPAVRRLYRKILARSGCIVSEAKSGVEAVTTARQVPPDVVLLNAQLTDVAGREALHWLRNNPALSATLIILLISDEPSEKAGSGDGRTLALRKPHSAKAFERVFEIIGRNTPSVQTKE